MENTSFWLSNSAKNVKDYVIKLANLDIEATEDDFFTSSQYTLYYLKKFHKNKCLYVYVTESLKAELLSEGFAITENLDNVECIIIGNDQELNLKKLYDISKMLLTRENISYIATIPDFVCLAEFGSVPDCGSICDMLYNVPKKATEFYR